MHLTNRVLLLTSFWVLKSLILLMIPRALQGLYFLCEPIADGTFGRLYLAIHVLTRQQVAIKVIDKKKLTVSYVSEIILG